MVDDNEADVLRTVRAMAQSYLIDLLMAFHFAGQKKPGDAADQLLGLIDRTADPDMFTGLDPATAALAAQEYRQTLAGHVRRARALATGEPFDADEFGGDQRSRQH